MDITICLDCGASSEGILPACPDCLSTHVDPMAQLQAGEIIYACGRCRQPRRLGQPENPRVSQTQFGRIQKGAVRHLPLTIWNTVFRLVEGTTPGPAAPEPGPRPATASPSATGTATASSPESVKKKTQPIPLVPPH